MADSRKRRYLSNADESSNKKKFETPSVTGHRFLIPSKAAGAMIGKGGEVIKRLRSEHNCRIIVPDSQGPERLVIIDSSPNTVIEIWNDILPSIKEYMNAKDCDYKGSSSKYIENENEIDLRMVVHESQAGAVIGKGGERIRNLIDGHGMTMIKLYKTFCPNSTDRVVRMVSTMENLMSCLENVFELLENQAIKGSRKDYNPDNYDESLAPSYGGFISKDSRHPPRRGIGNSGSGGHISDLYKSDDYMPQHSNPFSRSLQHGYDDGMHNLRPMNNQRNAMLERGVSDLFGGSIRMNSINDVNSMNLSRVTVPQNLVSAIVGKDGRRLNDLERECGANIEMDIDRMSMGENIFIIRGSPDQIYKAQCLMQLCARKFADDGF